jgi:hypothetical protein
MSNVPHNEPARKRLAALKAQLFFAALSTEGEECERCGRPDTEVELGRYFNDAVYCDPCAEHARAEGELPPSPGIPLSEEDYQQYWLDWKLSQARISVRDQNQQNVLRQRAPRASRQEPLSDTPRDFAETMKTCWWCYEWAVKCHNAKVRRAKRNNAREEASLSDVAKQFKRSRSSVDRLRSTHEHRLPLPRELTLYYLNLHILQSPFYQQQSSATRPDAV